MEYKIKYIIKTDNPESQEDFKIRVGEENTENEFYSKYLYENKEEIVGESEINAKVVDVKSNHNFIGVWKYDNEFESKLKALQTESEKFIEDTMGLYLMSTGTVKGHADEDRSDLQPIAIKLQTWRIETVNKCLRIKTELINGTRDIDTVSIAEELTAFNEDNY